jgi:hypothetical protein
MLNWIDKLCPSGTDSKKNRGACEKQSLGRPFMVTELPPQIIQKLGHAGVDFGTFFWYKIEIEGSNKSLILLFLRLRTDNPPPN